MKKLILTILIIALSITQVSVLGQMATKSEEKSNNKAGGNFYSAEYSIDQLKKLTGVADYEGIKKAIEDINKNYDYTEIISGEYNIDDRLSIHDDPGDNRFIYKISIYFTKDLEQPTIILCAGKAMTVFYSCSGEKFKKIVKDNFLDEPHNSIWTSKCNGAYIDDKFYYYNHTDGTIPNQVYDHSNYSTADSLYKYENGKLLDMEYTEEKAKEIDKAYSKDNYIKNYKLEPYLLNPDSGIIYNDSGIISRSGAYSTGEIKKIFLNDEQYNLKFFGDVKKEEYDKIMFLGATLWNTIHVFEHVIDDKTIAYWLANSAYIVNNNNGISQPLTGEYKKLFNEFKENYISLKEEEKYFDIDILNDYTKKFFGKVINTDADNNLYIDFEDVYHYAEGNLSVKGNKFSCNLKSNGRFDDVIQGLSVSNVKTYHNFAIIKINQFLYGHIEEAYLLVEKKNVDGVNRLFPILVNNYPYTFEAAEKELGHTLLKDYLSGFDKEEALKKNSSEELISYIDSFLKENNFIETSGLIDARQDELLDIYNEFKNNKLAYNLNAAVEFNQNFYESQKIDIEDVVNLQNYLSKLDIKDFNKYKPVVQIKMKPNEVGRYIFSFKDELKDDIIYNFHLDGLDINIILTKDDINSLKEKNTVFAIENFDNNVFITPLSKKRTTLPINLTINFSEVPEDKYISKVPTLYYFANDETKYHTVYTNHYGPIKFDEYDCKNVDNSVWNDYEISAFKNILSSKILSEESDSLDLDRPLTKGELARAVGFLIGDYDDDKDIKFDDVNEEDRIYIKSAIKHKIFNLEGSKFYPDEKITKAQLVYVLTEVLKLKGFEIENDELNEAIKFDDFGEFKAIENNVELTLELDIIPKLDTIYNSEEKEFNADKILNRDESMLLIYRALRCITKLIVEQNTHKEDFEAEKTLMSNVTNRLREPKIEEMNNLNSFIFIESESFLDKLEDLFENKIILILTILIVLIIIVLIMFLY